MTGLVWLQAGPFSEVLFLLGLPRLPFSYFLWISVSAKLICVVAACSCFYVVAPFCLKLCGDSDSGLVVRAVQDTRGCVPLQQLDPCQYLQRQDQECWELAFIAKCHCSYSGIGTILLDIELCGTRQGLWATHLLYHRSAATGSGAIFAGRSLLFDFKLCQGVVADG